MTFHKRHSHSHAYRDLEPRDPVALEKRDSHGDRIHFHPPEGFDIGQKSPENLPQTAVSVIYVTLPQTFQGPAMYSTMTGEPNATATGLPDNPTIAAPNAEPTPDSNTDSKVPTAVSSASPSQDIVGTNATPTGVSGPDNGSSQAATPSATAPGVASGSPADSAASGMSSGAQAGVAIGVICAFALVASIVFFCMRRKKSSSTSKNADNEKHCELADADSAVGAYRVGAGNRRQSSTSLHSTRTVSTAPRLSLRPVTEFLPNLAEHRNGSAKGFGLSGTPAASTAANGGTAEKLKPALERTPAQPGQNPFEDAAVVSEKQARLDSPPTNPFELDSGKPISARELVAKSTAPVSRHSAQVPAGSTQLATPSSSMPGLANGAGAVKDGASPHGPNNVHRVQLDFKPSMDDELELRSGQLVRMLHEYDDGWALCIRMDRSQQGVAPRTCLSKLPVKPRPQGPPSKPRAGTGPSSYSPDSSQLIHKGQASNAMYPRPLTPTQAHRSPSPTDSQTDEGFTSPVGPAPTRKPVPGQAM